MGKYGGLIEDMVYIAVGASGNCLRKMGCFPYALEEHRAGRLYTIGCFASALYYIYQYFYLHAHPRGCWEFLQFWEKAGGFDSFLLEGGARFPNRQKHVA